MARNPSGDLVGQANAYEHEQEILQYRIEGLSFRAIAAKMEMSLGGVHEAYKRAMADIKEHNLALAEHLVELETERLDEMQKAIHERSMHYGNLEGITALLKIHAARVKLLGLAAPESHAHKVSGADGGPVEFAGATTEQLLAKLPKALESLGPEAVAVVTQALLGGEEEP